MGIVPYVAGVMNQFVATYQIQLEGFLLLLTLSFESGRNANAVAHGDARTWLFGSW